MTDDLTVLVVDDDFRVARVHTAFVERVDGFRVVGAVGSAAEALTAVERLRPDLLLLDVHLPDLDGLEVLRRLRAEGSTVDVLVVTAERDVDAVQAARSHGAAGYLVKPFTADDLERRLLRVREDRRLLAAGRTADQAEIDRLFGPGGGSEVTRPPKGLSSETLQLVTRALQEHGELSAAECAELTGLARVTARRYLEQLVGSGRAQARQTYGRVGRPERRYQAAR